MVHENPLPKFHVGQTDRKMISEPHEIYGFLATTSIEVTNLMFTIST